MAEPLNNVIDTSHHNGNVNFNRAKSEGAIVGVIQKATQGRTFIDPTFKTNRTKAANAGLFFGAYHFGTGSDGVKQAEFFLDVVKPDDKTLLVLDFEDNPTGPSMMLEEARAFVTHVNRITGRFPGFYSGHTIKRLLGTNPDSILSQCWLWLAQYGPTPVVPPAWNTWTMWQYTDGAHGIPPFTVPGVGRCDREQFHGNQTQLEKLWFKKSE